MPIWLAAFSLAVAVSLPLLVTATLDPHRPGGNGYATWYVAAVGTLMTITAVRLPAGLRLGRHRRSSIVQTVFWSGPAALGAIGVIGSAAWVGGRATSSRTRSPRPSATPGASRSAEREATEWQAAQEAHLNERQFRLGQTSVMALPMLRTHPAEPRRTSSPAQRAECLHLEGAVRDEIRGRKLLNDAVREQVMLARRRGTTVTLLDEGGIDDLDERELDRVLSRLALALRDTTADKVIARTVPEGSEVAVTVVGLRSTGDGSASALGHDADDDEVELWLEIPRAASPRRPARRTG